MFSPVYIGYMLKWQVLNSLVRLKNLNLQGNPVAENDKLAKKVISCAILSC